MIGEGNGNPPQYSCLKNPRDRGVWWATVHGVGESDPTEWLHSLTHSLTQWIMQGFSGGSDNKESACNAEYPALIPEWGRSPREGNGNPLQCFCLENLMDRSLAGYNSWELQRIRHNWVSD